MASGTINFTKSAASGSYIDGKIEWSSTADSGANNSDVTAKLYVRKGSTTTTLTSPTVGNWSYSLNINGTKASGTIHKSVMEDWVLLCTKTVSNIAHNADGNKSITISGSVSAPAGTSYDGHTTTGSGTAILSTIARAATITSASNTTLGGKCTVKWSPAVSTLYYKIKFSMGSWSYTTGELRNVSSFAVTISLDAAKQIPKATTGTMTVTLYTYSTVGGQVGSASSKTITVTVPNNDNTIPSVSMALEPVSSLGSAFNGLYIQGKTKVKATITATGKYGATITGYRVQAVSTSPISTSNTYTSDYLTQYGDLYVYGAAQDSRGYSNVADKKINVIAYSKPKIMPASGESGIICARCDANGNLSTSGNYLKIKAKRSYSKVMSGSKQKNFCQIRYRYKVNGGSYSSWATILASNSLSSDEVTTGALNCNLSATSVYVVQVQAIDDIGETDYTTVTVPTDKVYCHRDGARRSFAFGEYVTEDDTFSVAEDITAVIRGRVRFDGEAWLSLGLYSAVAKSSKNKGRWGGTGCYYRVCAGEKHIYVAFNCSFATSSSTVRVNSSLIPSAYRPAYDVYALCAVGYADGGRGVATVSVAPSGRVNIYAVHRLSGTAPSSGETVQWIDGYIDLWT